MKINGQAYRTIWLSENNPGQVCILDQRALPHALVIEKLYTVEDTARAIQEMHVRGAPLIGAAAAWGMYLAARSVPETTSLLPHLESAADQLRRTRPTAVNLSYALNRIIKAAQIKPGDLSLLELIRSEAAAITEESVHQCQAIGKYGLELIRQQYQQRPDKPVQILTHCNAGWLACIDYGTATAPIYLAHDAGIPVHVWVDETRPRNQGARLTAYELGQHGVPHTIITDNAGGHLMQHGQVDLVLVGTDRTTRTGDVANKVGTYLKALAARDNQVPFYVAAPSSSIDWEIGDGLSEIVIEERDDREIKWIQGQDSHGMLQEVLLCPDDSPALNIAFDVTPASLITGLITERGICPASEKGLLHLFPEGSSSATKSTP